MVPKQLYALRVAAFVAALLALASRTMTNWGGDQGLAFESTGTPFMVKVIRAGGDLHCEKRNIGRCEESTERSRVFKVIRNGLETELV
jgi:hypothetical protein